MPLRQQRQPQLNPNNNANYRPLVHRRLANGIPLKRHLHSNLGKTHTPYLRLQPKSHPKIPRIFQQRSPNRPQINLFPLCIRALKEKR